ncbi:MAG: nuclear transport factor 2 family protein [Novosphingobium sp.]|nr:nuclear transport factor 2 family protein [Novosphingobium sp.]MCP5403019.1 nuclear transport factor 2 family protein [Novosphingobium sp.]
MTDASVAKLEAENAIRRLVSAYCDAVNRLDADAAGQLFAADAKVRIADFPELCGRDTITEGMRTTFAASSFLRQQCDAILIDVDGDRARSRISVFEVNRKPEVDDLGLIFGFYEDEYALLDGNWRFHRRRYTLQLRALLPASKIQHIPGFAPQDAFRA